MTAHSHSGKAAFLFDLDGVLVDTARFHFEAWRRLARELGSDFTHEQNEQLKGVSRKESLEKILSWGNIELSAADFEHYMSMKNEWYLEHVKALTPSDLLPGAQEFLSASREAGVATALGSASKNARVILEQLNIIDQLDAVIDGTKTTKSKPDPQVFLMGAEAVGIASESCVVFEDAISGVAAAKAGGMMAVGIGDPDTLSEADIVRASLAELDVNEALNLL